MESLAGSTLAAKLVAGHAHNHNSTNSAKGGLLRLREPHRLSFIPPSKFGNLTFSTSLPLLQSNNTLHYPIISASASLSSSSSQTDALTEEPWRTNDMNASKIVRVKFHLQKECAFGQQFLVLGDSPLLGMWDTSHAIPLNWSDGHEWAVELDVPIGELIKFKFILQAGTEDVLWQPGPDRILQTWETAKVISVYEDWEKVELQKIIEEEPTTNGESTADSEILIVTDKVNPPRVGLETDANAKTVTTHITASPTVNPLLGNSTAIVADNVSEINDQFPLDTTNIESGPRDIASEKKEVAVSVKDTHAGSNGTAIKVENFASAKDEISLVSYEEVPALVPGLMESSPPVHMEKERSNSADALLETEKVEDLNVPELELRDEKDNCSPNPEITEAMTIDKQQSRENEQVEKPQFAIKQEQHNTKLSNNAVFKNDIQWGRITLQKFLANLGFR